MYSAKSVTTVQNKTSTTCTGSKPLHHGSTSGKTDPCSSTLSATHRELDISRYFFSQQKLSKKHKLTDNVVKVNLPRERTAKNVPKKAQVATRKSKVVLVYEQLVDPNCKLEALFLKSVLPIFEETNEIHHVPR
ncbi:uncharacterized protein LOC121410616 [Lytechinus variegatus]|uniref:uncharacterized protein LOC121410616 n=1 Tax=Lytechinus variegatus TaxID=7654 RepID=UPI001BB1C87A|nr:uncharacterized protein LOC121410616 [Lytechinus variegatus]